MKIKKLIVKGFMRFKEQQEIIFPENQVILIFGENGAGKTSLLDAICVSLYGRTFRTSFDSEAGFLSLSDLVNHDSTKATIHLEFENHGHNFVVKREITREDSDGDLLEDGELKAESKDVFDYVGSKAIGFDWEGFSRSTVILQGEMSSLSDALPGTRKAAFVKLFGLDKYCSYEQVVRGQIEGQTMEIKEMEAANEVLTNEIAKIPQVESSIKRLKKIVSNLEQRKASSGRKVQQLAQLKKNLEKDYHTYIILNGRIDSLNKQKNSAEKILEQKRDELRELNTLRNESPSIKKSYKEFLSLNRSLKSMKELKTRYDKWDGKLNSLTNSFKEKKSKLTDLLKDIKISKAILNKLKKQVPSAKEISRIREEISQLERRKLQLEDSRYKLDALLNVAIHTANELKAEMGKIRRKQVCPVCAQKIPNAKLVLKHYANEIKVLERDADQRQKQIDSTLAELSRVERRLAIAEASRNKLESLYSKQSELFKEIKRHDVFSSRRDRTKHGIEQVTKEIEKYRKQIKLLRFNIKEYNAIEKRITMLRQAKIVERFASTNTQLKRLPKIKGEIGNTSKNLTKLERQRRQLLLQIKKLKDIENRFAAVRAELQTTQSAYNQNIVVLTKEQTNYKTLEKQLAELKRKERKLRQNEDEIEMLQEDVSSFEELGRIFTNIPENILRRLIPHIEKEGTAIISELSEGIITSLNIDKETLNIGATTGGMERPIQYFSGGQQTRINMALRIAISRILSKLPHTEEHVFASMQTLFIDEGDFGNLDEVGVRETMGVIQNLTREFNRIVLISHLDSVRENFRGYTVEVVKSGSSQSTINAPRQETVSTQREAL
ncbi:MAG: AAA family ATPase [Nitrososphaerales archaeon]